MDIKRIMELRAGHPHVDEIAAEHKALLDQSEAKDADFLGFIVENGIHKIMTTAAKKEEESDGGA